MLNKIEMKEIFKTLSIYVLAVFCFIPYLPLFVGGLMIIAGKCCILELKLLTGIGCQRTGSVGKINYKYPISDVTKVADNDELQFLKFRSPLYLFRMTVWAAREIAKYWLGYQTVGVVSEEELIFALTHTLFAHSLEYDKELEMYKMVFEGLENFHLYKNYFWDVREIRFNKQHTKMTIVLKGGNEVHWPCPESKIPDWTLAKLHAQVCLTFSAPGLSHTHVHFVFPSTMTVVAKTVLPADSFLRRLLDPHLRFTERINYQALNMNISTDNKQTFLDKHYFLWKVIPVNKEQFVEGVIRKCHKHYHEYSQNDEYQDEDSLICPHPHFPPSYIQHKKYREIPYLAFISAYYAPVRKFVQSVSHLISPNEWQEMSKKMARHVPGIEQVDMVDVIATFIHTVAVVHFCDHITFARYYGKKYACMELRFPFESFDNEEHWNEVLSDFPELSFDKVKNKPSLLMKEKHVTRTRIFANIFVDYIPDLFHDLSLMGVKYDFKSNSEKPAIEAADQFKQDLTAVDQSLQKQEAPVLIPGRDRSKTDLPQTMQLIPVQDFIASVCF